MRIKSVKAWWCPTEFCTTRPQSCIAIEPECCERVRIYPERVARLLERAAKNWLLDDGHGCDVIVMPTASEIRKWRSDWRKAMEEGKR